MQAKLDTVAKMLGERKQEKEKKKRDFGGNEERENKFWLNENDTHSLSI